MRVLLRRPSTSSDELVEVATLDELVRGRIHDTSAVFTKMDVQGYELQVIAGGEVTLGRSALVQLEMSLLPLVRVGALLSRILEAMERRGFRLVGIEPGFASPTGALLQADGLFITDEAFRSYSQAMQDR